MNRGQVIENLVEDLEVAIKTCAEKEQEIATQFMKISCTLVNNDQKVMTEDDTVSEFLLMVHLELEADHFTLASIHKLADHQNSLNLLQTVLEESDATISRCLDTILKTTVVANNTIVPPNEIQESIHKFWVFMALNEED